MNRITNVHFRRVIVQFSSSGHTSGSPPSSAIYEFPGNIQLPSQGNLARTGHTFGGWRLGLSGAIFQPGAWFALPMPTGLTSTVNFNAVWNAVAPTAPDIFSPMNNAVVPWEDLTITWRAVPGARYHLTLRDLRTYEPVSMFDDFLVPVANGNSFTIPQMHLVMGVNYRITIATSISGNPGPERISDFSVIDDPFFRFYGELGWRFPINYTSYIRIQLADNGYRLLLQDVPGTTRDHEGVDFSFPASYGWGAIHGTPIFAPHGGVVIRRHHELNHYASGTAGNFLAIQSNSYCPASGQRIVSRYLHLRGAPLVGLNDSVARNDHIGYVGNSGTWMPNSGIFGSSGHLHFDVNNTGSTGTTTANSLNPERFFPNADIRPSHHRSHIRP
jgi:hypothetical protein